MLKLSVIIPVYNTGLYLARCLDSILLSQDMDLSGYELIIINDGSTDNSEEIILSYQGQYNNINYIKQENRGLGASRNVGINAAKGRYIMFVDSDDFIQKGCLNLIYSIVEKDDLDIIHCDKVCINEGDTIINESQKEYVESQVFSGRDFLVSFFSEIAPESCLSVFKRTLLLNNHVFFRENVYYEDIAYNYKAILNASKVKRTSIQFYCYYLRSGTISRGKQTIKHYVDKLNGFVEASDYFREKTQNDLELKTVITNWLYLAVKNWIHSCSRLPVKERIVLFGILKKSNILQYISYNKSFVEKFSIWIINIPLLAILLFNLYSKVNAKN